MDEIVQVLTQWKTAGALAGTLALVNLLINLTKNPAARVFVPPRWRPVLACGLGFVSVALGAAAQGAGAGSLAAGGVGALVGLASSGFHELVSQTLPSARLERQAARAIKAAVQSGEVVSAPRLLSLSEMIGSLRDLPNEKMRLQALADWVARHPVT